MTTHHRNDVTLRFCKGQYVSVTETDEPTELLVTSKCAKHGVTQYTLRLPDSYPPGGISLDCRLCAEEVPA